MAILRVTAEWTGFLGAPGYSSFHFMGGGGLISDAQQVATRVRDAFDEVNTSIPVDVQIAIHPEVEEIDEATGEVTGFQVIDPGDPLSGVGGGGYSAPSGAVVNWRTNDLRFGRRIRGRTFLVPLNSGSYDSDGTLSEDALQEVRAFADVLTTPDFDSELVVWSRPIDGSGGVAGTVVGYSVPDKAAVLRSRRD